MKDKTFKLIVVVAACILSIGAIGSAVANVKGLFGKKDDTEKKENTESQTAYVQYVDDVAL